MKDYVIYCALTRVILFVVQKASKQYLSLLKPSKFRGFLEQLFGCDLCLGVWLYTLFAWLLDINVLYEFRYVPVVSEVVTGIITSFIVWLLAKGWNSQFQIVWLNQQE